MRTLFERSDVSAGATQRAALRRTRFVRHTLARVLGLGLLTIAAAIERPVDAQGGCTSNPIVCENQLTGNFPSEWDITGAGDLSVQGFATEFSVVSGQPQQFKIDTPASSYAKIDIYRMGYYNGRGARKVATIPGSEVAAQNQPNCLANSTTGLIDCGNWSISATWVVPANAVSGIYFARPELSNGDASHIFFVVRDDSRAPDLLFQTSDTTWQAYNKYGGNSLYVGGPGTSPGRAYKVSYNRPFTTRAPSPEGSPEDWVFNAEYPMVRWLEANGYDVAYMGGADTDRFPTKLTGALKPKVFLSVGHDEYWSGTQRTNVEAARAAGVHLAFFSGNAVFWKTRWETSIDGSGTQHRTLVSYKETHANAIIDPDPAWTGTWRDPRFSPPKDGGRPENGLMGTSFRVNSGTTEIRVPAALGKHRFWRHTNIADLQPGDQATLANDTLGYEWDEAPTNAFTPSGLMRLSSTTSNGDILLDHGSSYGFGQATHSLTLYRHSSGALVFGGGTIQWSWGLDQNHDRGNSPPDVRMKQATVNLFKDMGVDATTLEGGLVAPTPSTDATPPTSVITSPSNGASFSSGTNVTISGTASDTGGGIVTGVEVSVDGGATWSAANGTTTWSLQWTASGSGTINIRSRAFDDTGNFEAPGPGIQVTVGSASCPCTLWGSTVPAVPSENDSGAVEVGTRFRADTNGSVIGIRFYKGPLNTGTHVGRLWSNTGTELGEVTFTNETASGWQVATFASPIPITANTTYVVSYHAPNGHYAAANDYFLAPLDAPPLHAPQDGANSRNGVYRYGAGGVFPTDSYRSSAYFVDPVFTTGAADTTPPTVTTFSPPNGATGVSVTTAVTATFNEAMDSNSISSATFELRNPSQTLVPSTISYDSVSRVATLQPNAALATSTTYSVTVRGGAAEPRVKDLAGNALAASVTWSFTTAAAPPPPPSCPCTIWTPDTVPATVDTANDNSAVELGTRFRADVAGFITGARFYKSAANTGTHTATLWSNTGTLLGNATFTGETSTGWQETSFPSPIAISANTTYVISYHAPNGRYSSANNYFAAAGVDRPPLHGLANGVDGANGVYVYGASAFPTNTHSSTSYFVDVVFTTTIGPDTTPPVVVASSPAANQTGVSTTPTVTATFNEAMDAGTINTNTFLLRDPLSTPIQATVTYSAATRTATLTPTSQLDNSTTYTAVVEGGTTDPRVKDASSNALANDFTWSFTTAAPPPPPPTQGPGGPVLVITAASNPFTTYLAEILRTEGLNAFLTADISTVSAATLSNYDVVILGEMQVTAGQVSMLTDWTTQGGNLIAMRPDKDLVGLFGLADAGGILQDGYLLVNTAAAPGAGIVNQTIQFHGIADRYTLSGATAIATLYSDANTATANPAVTIRSVGANGGQAVAFTYDLARSVVYTRQGNPAWSGDERDGQPPIRSDDLFFGGASPDWVDLDKVHIPQADEQQRLLWNTILHVNADRKPLPRFWYFPRMLKAVVVMTGDDHSNGGTIGRFDHYLAISPANCSVTDWQCIRGTSYVYPATNLSDAQISNYVAQGFEIGLHVTTQCGDYTPATLASFYSNQLAEFAANFPTAPAPATNRTHCIAWSDYDTQPQVAFSNGIRFDTNYYYWPGSWILDRPGMFTGSGMPMRFTTTSGQMVDVFQAATQMTDESGQSYPLHADSLFGRALGSDGFYGAFTANMHTDFNPSAGSEGSDAIITSAQALGIPVVSSKQMLDWLDGRNGSSFGSITWSGNVLSFQIAVGAGANGLQALVPANAAGGPITAITRNGSAVTPTTQLIKGVSYAVFAAQPGSYQVVYGNDETPPVISNVVASPGNNTATITWTTDEPSDSRVDYGTNPNTLNQSASIGAFTTAHGVTLTGLTSGTTYHYRVSSADGQLNVATSPATPNPPASFTTTQPQPSLSISDVSVTEGNSGTTNAVFTVNLSASSASTVTVQFATAGGTATAGSDFVTTSGTLDFTGVTEQTITVPVVGDALNELNEQFLVNLSNAVNATIADGQGAGTILNDDPIPTLSIADASVSEGQSGIKVLAFNVNLSAASGQTVTVLYATANGTATAGSDYVAASATATFNAGVTTVPVNITINGDTAVEASEQFVVNLTNPSNATIADGQATGTILNDDGVPALSVNNASVTEGNTGNVNAVVTVSLSASSAEEVTVAYATANGTASASDYTGGSAILTFPIGSTSQTVTVPVIGDTLDEANETIQVNLSAPTNATIGDAQGIITITDDDNPPTVSVSDVSLTEGNSGTQVATFNLTLSAASGRTVTVRYGTANGTASSGSDYVAVGSTTTATFQPGTTTATANVTVNGDVLSELNETFAVNLNTPTNVTIADGQGIGTIQNDDALPNLTMGNRTVTEGNTGTLNANFTVTLSPASGATVTVNYATLDGAANAGSDYVAKTGTLTFTPGATSRTITVLVNGDLTDEDNETYTVNLSAPVNANITDSQGLGTITDNDAAPTITISDFSLAEGNSGPTPAGFTLTLSLASGKTVSVAYATANGTATTAGSDYVAAAGTATFQPGVASVVVPVTINGDTTAEPNENFVMNLTAPSNATIARAQGSAVILNDDGATPPPAGLVAAYGFEEGAGFTANDASGNGHTGNISGATWTTAGRNGNALSFDGVNDMVSVADSGLLDITRMTVMAWVRPSTLVDYRTVLIKERSGGLAYALYGHSLSARPQAYINTGGSDILADGTLSLSLNTWAHLAATYDGANLRLYVNGALVRTRAATGNIVTTTQMLRIGGNTVWGEFFGGLIDDVRVYNRALSLSEIQTDMAVAVP